MNVTKAGPKEWFGLVALLLPTVLLFLTMTVLFLATPYIAAELKPGSGQLLWINDIYGFMMAGLLVAMGTLGDRVGRRRILLFGAAAFGVASLAAAYSPNAEALIAARAVMGIGAAAVTPSTLSLISNMFKDARQRGTAIGMWAAAVSVGVAIGPLVGGLLLESFWWGAALLIGVPVMAVVLVAAPLLVPEYRAPGAGRVDVPSVLLSMVTLLPLVYGIKELAKAGPTLTAVLTLVAGLFFGVVFVRRQLRIDSPLLDVRLFANRSFSGALGVFLLSATAVGGVYLLFTQTLQLVMGQSALATGLWILPAALMLIAVSTFSPIIARRVRPAYVIAAGSTLSIVGYLVMTQVESVGGLPLLIVGFWIMYPGIAPTMALSTALVIGSAPPEKAGAASAVNTTASDLGVSLGVAILGSIGTAVYRGAMSGAPGAAQDSLATAGGFGDEVLASARAAFTDGLNVAAGVAAVLVAGAVLLTLTQLRRVPPTAQPEPSKPVAAEEEDILPVH